MVLLPDDLVCYAAEFMPEDEVSINGGNISNLRVDFDNILDMTYSVEGVATDADVTLTIRRQDGTKVSITQTGNSSFVLDDKPLELLKMTSTKPFAPGGKILAGDKPICKMKLGDHGITQMFIDSFAMDQFGGTKMYYMKFFWKNTNATDKVTNAVVSKSKTQTINPKDLITFALVAVQNDDSNTINRLTPPDKTIFNDADKLVPGIDLYPSNAIGVWLFMKLKQNLPPAGFAYKSQCVGQVAGVP